MPLSLPLDTPLPRQCDYAMPLLEAIEQRAAREHVPVDARIERGRTYRHAIQELLEHERYDRIVVAAASNGGDGFDAGDVAWLLDHAGGADPRSDLALAVGAKGYHAETTGVYTVR